MSKTFHHQWHKSFTRFLGSVSGSFTTIMAVTLPMIILLVGTTYDISRLHQANQLAQITADNMALFASTSLDRQNGDYYKNEIPYSYVEISANGADFTKSMTGKVEYDIASEDVDGDRIIARATVGGSYIPVFMGVFNNQSAIPFSVTSDVIFSQDEQNPASVFFVTDISGSMNWGDAAGLRKIDSLKSSLAVFMTELEDANSSDVRVLRSGLFAYSSWTDSARSTMPKWGILEPSDISKLQAGGGTNSTPALNAARQAFMYEDAIHEDENGSEKPLKFLIFMSDGYNGGPMSTQCRYVDVWVGGAAQYWKKWKRGRWKYKWKKPKRYWKWTHVPAIPGSWEQQEVCDGEPYNVADHESVQLCDAMRDENVVIYSIAYNITGNGSERAKKFMEDCSSGSQEYYMDANTGADLSDVFKEIGAKISKEVVRLKS